MSWRTEDAINNPAAFAALQAAIYRFRTGYHPDVAARMSGIDLGNIDIYSSPDRAFAETSRTGQQIFDNVSPARTNPGIEYWVDRINGNDAFSGLNRANAFKSINVAQQAASASGQTSCRIVIIGLPLPLSANTYDRTFGYSGASGTIGPTIDTAFISIDADVISTVTDNNFAFAADGTYTTTYSNTSPASLPNMEQVVDTISAPDQYGNLQRLLEISTPAILDKVASGKTLLSSKGYLKRADGLAPIQGNTQVMRGGIPNFFLGKNVNVYFGSDDGTRFQMRGGGSGSGQNGVFTVSPDTLGTSKHVVIATNVDPKYGFRSYAVDNFHGYVVAIGSDIGASSTDGLNVHNTLFGAAADCVLIGINCTGYEFGRKPNDSNQFLTAHENAMVVAIGGRGGLSAGAVARSIGTSATMILGTILDTDRGDVWVGNKVTPTHVLMDEQAKAYLDGVRLLGPANMTGLKTTGTGVIYQKRIPPNPYRNFGDVRAWA